MKTAMKRLSLAALSIVPGAAFAHAGHSVVEGYAHFFTPEHVFPALIALAVIAYVLIRRKDRQ